MTDRQRAAKARAAQKRKGKVGPKSVIAVGMVTVVAFLSLLGWQVAAGKDPALGHGQQKRKVVHRKVKHYVIKRVEVQAAPATAYSDGGSSSGGYSSSGSSSGGYSSGGSSSYSAPTYSAPTYTPPAPAVSSGASGG
jgi:uncharacterized membrane protein YgcG